MILKKKMVFRNCCRERRELLSKISIRCLVINIDQQTRFIDYWLSKKKLIFSKRYCTWCCQHASRTRKKKQRQNPKKKPKKLKKTCKKFRNEGEIGSRGGRRRSERCAGSTSIPRRQTQRGIKTRSVFVLNDFLNEIVF